MATSHRKQVRHFEEFRHLHELTFSCYQRRPLLTNDHWRGIFARNLASACTAEDFRLIAFVCMPEHVHLLVLPGGPNSKISRLMARMKQPTSKEIRKLLEANRSPLLQQLTVRERPGKYCFRFWQEGPGFDRNIFTAEAISASIEYIHENPVKSGLCQRVIDFKWSSARFHLEQITEADPARS